jgi:hypothetical protein
VSGGIADADRKPANSGFCDGVVGVEGAGVVGAGVGVGVAEVVTGAGEVLASSVGEALLPQPETRPEKRTTAPARGSPTARPGREKGMATA